ncbi:MAG: tyrosine-type recombinase/integrase [Dorea sp.]
MDRKATGNLRELPCQYGTVQSVSAYVFLLPGYRNENRELTGLTWKDIDLVNGIISVNHTMHYTEINRKKSFFVTTPKTESGTREIPIVMDLRRQLLRQREYDLATGIHGTAQIDGYTDFVFHTTKGTPYSTAGINLLITRIVNRYNKQETDRAEKEHRSPELLPNFSPHILRHTFCTRFCENESNIKVIQEIMGTTI